jgi:mannose-6-phosphate isomerase-like protein (cupin superfamily)
MSGEVDLAEKINAVGDFCCPGIFGHINDGKVAVVGVQGAFVWHMHDNTDEFFLVLHGQPTIQLRDRDVELSEGEVFVVPRGIEHCPTADREAQVLLIEPRGTVDTGDAGGDLTSAEQPGRARSWAHQSYEDPQLPTRRALFDEITFL